MTKRLEPDFRLGLTGAIVSYLSWGLMPIYWNLLEGAGSVEVIAHRILWSLLFIPLVMAVRGKLRSAWSDIKSIFTSPVTALLLATAACFAGLSWWINVIAVSERSRCGARHRHFPHAAHLRFLRCSLFP